MLTTDASILRSLDDMISIVDKNYRYVAVSHGYTQFFNLPEKDIVGKLASELHGEEIFNTSIKPELDKTLAGENVTIKFWRPDGNGQMRCIQSQHSVYNGPLTDGPGVAVVARDITFQEETKAELEKEQALLKSIIDSIPDFIFTKDSEGAYQICNASFANFLELSPEQIIGKTDKEIMTPQSAAYIIEKDRRVRETLTAEHHDEWVTYNDGRRRLLDMHKQPLQLPTDQTAGVLGIGRNVTHEREAEQKLLISSLFFQAACEPYLIFSADSLLITANQEAHSQLKELPANNQKKLSFSDLFYYPNTALSSFHELMDTQSTWQGVLYSSCHTPYFASITRVHSHESQEETFLLILRDQNTHQQQADDLLSRAHHDPLTHLPNRLMLLSRLESSLVRAERQIRQIAVLFIDLNKFKQINDSFGHATGDQVLIEAAKRMEMSIRSTDTLARFGGDEFVAILDINSTEETEFVAQKLLDCLAHPINLGNDKEFSVSASVGISIFPRDADNAETLLSLADQAMYEAKKSKSSAYCQHQK